MAARLRPGRSRRPHRRHRRAGGRPAAAPQDPDRPPAESLINDGTALRGGRGGRGSRTGRHLPGTAARFLLAYAGGVAIGAACAAVVVALRRRLRDRVLESALAVITPFATYLPAQSLGVSGVVAVVTCGLIGSQAGPKVISAGARVQITGFREVIAVRLLWLYSVPYLSKPYVRAAGPRDRGVRLQALVALCGSAAQRPTSARYSLCLPAEAWLWPLKETTRSTERDQAVP
ncbi:cation:proton antiporter domain-containing protein [Streptomyces sp. 1222.5]|uniref:cation:proton antiporter domain-containing protein n=1 Tax=Streptomyces sp. 1222.5 TaxID=1881026 RepID=UPI003D734648